MTDVSRRPRVHQVLTSLGYGDAIGNEVLGITRALRNAGFLEREADDGLPPLRVARRAGRADAA